MFDLQADWGADVLISLVEPEPGVTYHLDEMCSAAAMGHAEKPA